MTTLNIQPIWQLAWEKGRGRGHALLCIWAPFSNASVSCFQEQLAEPQCPRPSPSLLSRISLIRRHRREFKAVLMSHMLEGEKKCTFQIYILMMFNSTCNSQTCYLDHWNIFFFLLMVVCWWREHLEVMALDLTVSVWGGARWLSVVYWLVVVFCV